MLLLCAQNAQGKARINIGFGVHSSPPFALVEQERLIGGVIYDIGEQLAATLDVDVNYVFVPRTRIEQYLLTGMLDVYLISNPVWLDADNLVWSSPLFAESNVIVQRAGSQDFSTLGDLHQQRLGTIRGYVYPALTQAFERGSIYRSDVRSLTVNFQRLDKGWIDGFIGSDILIHHALQKRGDDQHFQIASYLVSRHHIRSVISPKSAVAPDKLQLAISQLKSEGGIDAILARYTQH